MRWLASLVPVVLMASLCGTAHAADLPYDEHANATQDVQRALQAAHSDHKDVLLVFGANWCPDCRVLDSVLHQNAAISGRFVVVKIDVGDFNKNLDLVKRYEVPLRKGIPAAAVVSSEDQLLYVTQGGELANAHHMGESAIVDLFSHIVADASVAGRSTASRSP
jgi:thioredoxin 1